MIAADAAVEAGARSATGGTGARPRVTVVVPARNEEHVLPRTLPVLLAATAQLLVPSDVVVVTPATSPMVAAPPVVGENLRWEAVTVPGKYHAIQSGAATTEAEVLLLVDADVLVEPGTLQALADPILDGRADVCAGRVDLTTWAGRGQPGLLARWASVSFDAWDRMRRERADLRWALPGAVYAIRRSLLPAALLVPLVDDASVGLHAYDQGATFFYEPAATVRTPPQDRYGMWARQKIRSRRGWAALADHRPQEVAALEATFRLYLAAAASKEPTRHVMYAQDRMLRTVARGLGKPDSGGWVPGRTEQQWNM